MSALGDELKIILTKNEELQKLTSSPMMLAILCTLSLIQSQHKMILYRKQRICLVDSLSQFTLRLSLQKTEEANVVLDFLIDIALYLHERSPSGLIEELDLRNILRRSVNSSENMIDSFIHLIDSETCLFVPRGLCIYGFSHLLYEEYYICLYILRMNKNSMETNHWDSVAQQFHRCALYGPRFREPINLALSFISWKWSETDYDLFCTSLLNNADTGRLSDLIPLGAICLLSSIPELVQLPSTEIIFNTLNQCIEAGMKHKWFDYFPAFVTMFKTALNELPSTLIRQWLHSATDGMIDAISQFILQTDALPSWYDQCFSHYLCKQLMINNHKLSCCLFPFLVHLNKSLLPQNDLGQHMITNKIQTEHIHPLVLSVIICFCGGLTRSETDDDIVTFSPERMHRQSEYSSILIQNLYSDPEILLNYCHNELLSNSTHPSVDLLIMCCCLDGCKDELLTWPLVQRFQQLALDICSSYFERKYDHDMYKPDINQILTLLAPLIDCCQQDILSYSSSSVVITSLSRLFAVRATDSLHINFPYKLCHWDVEQLNTALFILSRTFQPDIIPASYRHIFSSQCLSLTHRVFLISGIYY